MSSSRNQVRDVSKSHYWMGTIEATYLRVEEEGEEPALKAKRMNVVFTNNKKVISYSVLNQARKGCLIRLNNEFHIAPEHLLDIVFLGTSYLGLMSEEEFNDVKDEPEAQKTIQ